MDLNSMLNSDSGAGGRASRQQAPAQSHPLPLSKGPSASPSITPAPHTPIQPHPQRGGFREYSQSVHASPTQAQGPPQSEYHPGHPPPGPPSQYASPTTQHPPPGAFSSRPAPPPLQPPGPNNDPRSPGSAHMSGPSPYRHTPTSSLSANSQGYPFPPSHIQGQPPPSPQQRHQYGAGAGPAGPYRQDSRDSYASPGGSVPPPVGMPTPHGSVSYLAGQQQSMPPQTPPVTTPGGTQYPYMHHQQQRSQSMQSKSAVTPTAAPPQPFGPPYGPQGGSPIATTHPLPQQQQQFDPRDQRQSSQPPTPLGPPAAPRQVAGQFAQPSSPFQQRISSSISAGAPPHSPYSSHPPQQLQAHAHQQQQVQPSPPPPYSASLPQPQSRNNSQYDAVSDSHRRSQSHASQERERSLSVSPKTRIPSLSDSLSGTGPGSGPAPQRPSSIGGESADYQQHYNHPQQQQQQQQKQQPQHTPPTSTNHVTTMRREGTPAKRKLEDRDLRPEELQASHRRPPPPQLNGNHNTKNTISQSSSPVAARRKRIRHTQAPIWAQSGRMVQPNASRNYTLRSKEHVGGGSLPKQVNGDTNHAHVHAPPQPQPQPQPHESKIKTEVKSEHISRHNSPEANRVKPENSDHPNIGSDNRAWKLLDGRPFPIQTISLNSPLDYLTRVVADYLFQTICVSEFAGECKARGIQWEIEAKLGTIVDLNTQNRIKLPVNGECAITGDARVAFRSSMTLAQHRVYNEWLNSNLATTHPQNPHTRPYEHVPISYKHRREVDEFYELPPALAGRLPGALVSLQRSKHSAKARITRDQQTGDILATIVKARVSDLQIHLPMCPLDCRISISLEWDWDGPPDEILAATEGRQKSPNRAKDRMSYSQGHFQVDLTQVSQTNERTGQVEKEHELEVEMDAAALIEQGQRAQREEPNLYPELVETFVNNIRALARQCSDQD
ncbi:CYTH-like domain-containing protein [Truncatella angustata]|uniref:mRNA-capping enzyme subunit beta n=1 Tax=Truncatella angustata TaxID=152316 RepID=A0A9P8UB41_9PEZI|nr:CYTH-like domain-containing protein [Truncatella angustata]KAH6645497.1 CYTH-like domain-containing protein [Truncatella angustata]KAH8196477.1 hypothetical protein TruAng_009375 [Truncatella angustata]